MTIDETIEKAAELFQVRVRDITAGGRIKTPRVIVAREWVIQQFPDMSANQLAKHLGYCNHTVILAARKRLDVSRLNNVDMRSGG